MRFVPPNSSEFPNDNPSLHEGAAWVCLEPLAQPRAVVRPQVLARSSATLQLTPVPPGSAHASLYDRVARAQRRVQALTPATQPLTPATQPLELEALTLFPLEPITPESAIAGGEELPDVTSHGQAPAAELEDRFVTDLLKLVQSYDPAQARVLEEASDPDTGISVESQRLLRQFAGTAPPLRPLKAPAHHYLELRRAHALALRQELRKTKLAERARLIAATAIRLDSTSNAVSSADSASLVAEAMAGPSRSELTAADPTGTQLFSGAASASSSIASSSAALSSSETFNVEASAVSLGSGAASREAASPAAAVAVDGSAFSAAVLNEFEVFEPELGLAQVSSEASADAVLAGPFLPTAEDNYAALVKVLVDLAMARGATRAAAMLPALLNGDILPRPALGDALCQALTRAGIGRADDVHFRPDAAFLATAEAWRNILRGEGADLNACGSATLDDWTATLLVAALGGTESSRAVKRELRRKGVAAFGFSKAA